jgi:hypothetical protein
VTISANSIKISKRTVTFELPVLPEAPSAVETAEATSVEVQPESGEPAASGGVVDAAAGGVASVLAQASAPF